MIHPTAIVDPKARLGRGVEVGPFCWIERDVEVGDGCRLGPRVTLHRYTTLGSGCEVHAGAVLGDVPQDVGFAGGRSYVRVGCGCRIREGVTIHRGTRDETATVIGDGCFLMAFSHCAHNVTLGREVVLANGALLAGHVQIGDRAFISGNVAVHQFVRLGRLVMLGGNAGASKDVPPFCLLKPCELNAVAGVNVVGLRRAGFSPAERQGVRDAYRLLYRSGLNLREAAERLRDECDTGPAREMARFVEQSERGICGAR